jgi:cytochrome c oxidase subunit 4
MTEDHGGHHVNYFVIFIVLCVFTALSVLFDVLSIENRIVLIVLVLAVAVAKASCVMMFFMHLKFEGNWKYVLLGPTAVLAIGLPLALIPDIGVPYYYDRAPQKLEAAAHHDSTATHDADAQAEAPAGH